MSSVIWKNETERANYYEKEFKKQLAISIRLGTINNMLIETLNRIETRIDELTSETDKLQDLSNKCEKEIVNYLKIKSEVDTE